jgi:F-box-like
MSSPIGSQGVFNGHLRIRPGPIEEHPNEVIIKIFSFLSDVDLGVCCLVSKKWEYLTREENICRARAFGKKKWERYFGSIGEEPPLPVNIYDILMSPCPFYPGQLVKKTHMLVLIPETVNEMPLTLESLENLVKSPKVNLPTEGYATEYKFIWPAIKEEYGHKPSEKSHWVLMTKDILSESEEVNCANGKALAQFLVDKKVPDTYHIPKVLEAAVCIFTKYVSSKKCLYDTDPMTYTCCEEKSRGYPLIIGGFSEEGLQISYYYGTGIGSSGIAVLQRF